MCYFLIVSAHAVLEVERLRAEVERNTVEIAELRERNATLSRFNKELVATLTSEQAETARWQERNKKLERRLENARQALDD